MKNGQAAMAIAGGYVLGRRRKTRLALALAALAARRGLGGQGGGRAGELLKSPELSRLTKNLRGELLAAGKAAAAGAVSNRVDSLSDRLEQRATSLRTGPPGEKQKEQEQNEQEQNEHEEEGKGEEERTSSQKKATSGGSARGKGEGSRTTSPPRKKSGSGGAKRETGSSGGARKGGSSMSARQSRG
ncbi:hypothetical protein [Streptomyces sp. 7N604]|uniref:hypothetical protein n=1 Tax=Streptomyces sp. 7N604 TaxID=3457415 RepID=UPI003FD342EF